MARAHQLAPNRLAFVLNHAGTRPGEPVTLVPFAGTRDSTYHLCFPPAGAGWGLRAHRTGVRGHPGLRIPPRRLRRCGVSRRGRRAALPPGDHSRTEPKLPVAEPMRLSLAMLFAARSTVSCGPPSPAEGATRLRAPVSLSDLTEAVRQQQVPGGTSDEVTQLLAGQVHGEGQTWAPAADGCRWARLRDLVAPASTGTCRRRSPGRSHAGPTVPRSASPTTSPRRRAPPAETPSTGTQRLLRRRHPPDGSSGSSAGQGREPSSTFSKKNSCLRKETSYS